MYVLIATVPTRFCFESALELMAETTVGSFQMKGSSSGPPAPIKAILQKYIMNIHTFSIR